MKRKHWVALVFSIISLTVGGYLFYQQKKPERQAKPQKKSEAEKKIVPEIPNQIMCTRLPAVKIRGREPAWVGNYKLAWPNQSTLRVYFDASSASLADSILTIAGNWSKYCSIKFAKSNQIQHSDIRITMSSGGLSSAIGKECIQSEYKGQTTTFLEGLAKVKDPIEFRRIILHEFGHVLGVEHELKHPQSGITWNKPLIYKFYKDHYDWDPPAVDRAIFTPLSPNAKAYAAFDKTSIMVYAIAPPYASETIPWTTELSETDKICIASWYPKPLTK